MEAANRGDGDVAVHADVMLVEIGASRKKKMVGERMPVPRYAETLVYRM